MLVILTVLVYVAEGPPSPISPPCSSLVTGVLYGSFSLRELFPSRTPGCSWSLENPDPTKYSLYLRFARHPIICQTHFPMLLSLDHHSANQSCPLHLQTSRDQEVLDLCGSQTDSDRLYSFLQFDKNFVQLCLTRHPTADEPQVTKELLEQRLVEVLLINNENSSQFTCGVLCRWFEECLRLDHKENQDQSDRDGCGMTQTGCVCPNHNIVPPPIPLLPETPHSFSNGSLVPEDCCVTELHSNDAIQYDDEDLRVKTQRPRSADQPVFTRTEWSQWSVCSLTCGQGWQVRTRSCVSSPYGTLCSGALRETRMCNNTVSLHGQWEEWSSWSLCSVTCGRGSRMRTRKCTDGGGVITCERPEIQTKLCNIAVCPVEGQWSEWGPWSRCSVTCNPGVQQRQRRCSASVHGWAECKGPHQESRECANPSCSGGNWGNWNHWSLCSKTCDTGWQRRFRMCEGTGPQGYPCDGSAEEVRSCNEKKCPAPHEICKDEHLLSMSWKRASAGETVYNKCPTNTTGSASRRCMLDNNGVAFWGPPSFARCVSLEFRLLHLSLREHLAKGQRTLAGEGMSQIVRSLLELLQRRSYYSGDLLFSTEILRNVTDTFKRATYIPTYDVSLCFENLEKWEDAHQVAPGAALLMRILEDFIHLIGEAQKPFQSFLVVTNNLMVTIQREPVSAVSSDINFPMKGRRGMKDWARTSEDKLYIPKKVFTSPTEGDPPAVINSKILTVTVRPEPQLSEPMLLSVSYPPTLHPPPPFLSTSREAGAENWATEGCQTLASNTVHTKCRCSRISSYAVLAQQAKDPVSQRCAAKCTQWDNGRTCWATASRGRVIIAISNMTDTICIFQVNMLIGIVVFNKLMSRDGISDKSKKHRAGVPTEARSRLLLKCSKCGVISSTAMSSSTASSAMASLWSSCVVLPLLALTWMSAVLAITDRRSTLFQVLFAVFDSVQGFVIITVHCAMRREVGATDFEKDVDLACQTVIFKDVNTCNPATITGTLSRISLDDEDDPKLTAHQEGGVGVNFSSLPGNIPPPNLIVQVPTLGLNELSESPLKKELNMDQQRHGGGGEGDYMVLPRRTVSLKPPASSSQGVGLGLGGEDQPLNIAVEDAPFPPPPSPLTLHPAESEAYPADFVPSSVGDMNITMNLNRSYGTIKTMPHGHAVPSFLPFQKVMHTRKRHSELYHELNHSSKFHTIDRYNRDPAMSTFKVRLLPRTGMGTLRSHASPPPRHFVINLSVFSLRADTLRSEMARKLLPVSSQLLPTLQRLNAVFR
uniref:Adhesion G protein-coupled receptor B2 n=1 Tax=Oryzias sinensis TaxID=183150 RepID=A0A8C8DHU4_9TELE